MKTNWLIILLIIVAGSTINLGSTLKIGNPSIEFVNDKGFIGKNGDLFVYSIKLRSNENLVNFKVKPSVKGINEDCDLDFYFDENTHQAVVNYFYVLPENVKDASKVVLTFTLTDSKESNIKTKVIDFSKGINFAKNNETEISLTEI
ncbi:MAG: hypothetical protein JXR51_13440 [Bacteroidales bacterium]|nr:hypothetical protein [Bacteroidales bacterium]MBN2758170.1 hypothetical protein [Bacteroidales bacterium]